MTWADEETARGWDQEEVVMHPIEDIRRFTRGLPGDHHAATRAEIVIRLQALKSVGWKIRDWTPHTRNSPARRSLGRYHWGWDPTLMGRWLDRPYQIVRRDGTRIFVAEPYGISEGDLNQFAKLREQGWSISVSSEQALWYPGRTVAIWIERSRSGEKGAAYTQ